MSGHSQSNSESLRAVRTPPSGDSLDRRPALWACFAFSSGIIADRYLDISFWICLFFAVFLVSAAWFVSFRSRLSRRRIVVVFSALAVLGGIRHHQFWHLVRSDDVSHFCSEDEMLVSARGTLLNAVEIHDRPFGPHIPSWLEIDRSIFLLNVTAINSGGRLIPCSGRARVTVSGHLINLLPGDQIEVLGSLSRPMPVMNPGGFDYSNLLKQQGARCTFSVNHPASVKFLAREEGLQWQLSRARVYLRTRIKQIFYSEIQPVNQGLATSILLGDRTELTDELKLQFSETGTMHLLALSGLNVGILLGLVYSIAKFCGLPRSKFGPLLFFCVVLFIWVTDHQPSVTRAGIMAMIGLFAGLVQRRANSWNTLAGCAFALLVIHPPDLFDIGAQLSFLAVGAIIWTSGFSIEELYLKYRTSGEQNSLSFIEKSLLIIAQIYFVSIIIWIVTLPLVFSSFHLVTPVGLLIDLVMIPLGTFVLASGYGFVILGLIHPWISYPIGEFFKLSLAFLVRVIQFGQATPGGHFYIPDTPVPWLIAYYLAVAVSWGIIPTPKFSSVWLTRILRFSWPLMLILGLMIPFSKNSVRNRDQLSITFLSVGHGLACLVELPTGETLLYDCGQMGDGKTAQRAVEQLLWKTGRRRIDTIVLSHADSDHYNGLFETLKRFPTSRFLLSQRTARSDDDSVKQLLEVAAQQSTAIEIIREGMTMHSAGHSGVGCEIRVLHPEENSIEGSDNSQSVVLSLSYAGQTILLTGDLEGPPLVKLIQQSQEDVSVLQLPHHGSMGSRPLEMISKFQPNASVMSARKASSFKLLINSNPDLAIFSTAIDGAITITVNPDGQLRIMTHLPRSAKSHDVSQAVTQSRH